MTQALRRSSSAAAVRAAQAKLPAALPGVGLPEDIPQLVQQLSKSPFVMMEPMTASPRVVPTHPLSPAPMSPNPMSPNQTNSRKLLMPSKLAVDADAAVLSAKREKEAAKALAKRRRRQQQQKSRKRLLQAIDNDNSSMLHRLRRIHLYAVVLLLAMLGLLIAHYAVTDADVQYSKEMIDIVADTAARETYLNDASISIALWVTLMTDTTDQVRFLLYKPLVHAAPT
jgi:hypothetical protein